MANPQPHDSVNVQRRVDEACLAFEAAWQAHLNDAAAHPRPAIEASLTGDAGVDRPRLLRELLALEVAYRRRAGESPAAEEYLARFPDCVQVVAPAFAPGDRTTPPTPRMGVCDPLEPGTAVRYFGDYEILGEVGRGGMGVIYRARQRSLNRLVALKMIRGDVFAGPAEVQRFRLEAEAAARLDHEGIVPVYEVGEHDGQQYFTMRLVEGGSLAGRGVQSPAQAARLVEAVARAIHHAHQRGVLHRDLKPSNVLLYGDGRPLVTDFGLAKLTGSSLATQSGLAVGTPAYMAPEQARDGRNVTTAADVWGLGALLYDLLTGRPPFLGPDEFETLAKVVAEEPVPPGRLNAAVGRDLETVCLKCLRKVPQDRYASAEAVAEDLARWLCGAPIEARPVGRAEWAWRWCRRNPVVAGLTAGLVLALTAGATASSVLAVRAQARADEATEAQGAALQETAKALAAINKLQLAYDQLGRGVARNLIRPLAPLGQDRQSIPLSVVEAEALRELAVASDDLKLLFVEEALRGPLTRRQLHDRAPYALHAAVGLDAGLRDRVEQLLGQRLLGEGGDAEERRSVGLVLASLGPRDPSMRSRAAATVVRAIGELKDGDDLLRLARLAARLDAGSASAAAHAALQAIGKPEDSNPDRFWQLRLAQGLVALAGRMDADNRAAAAFVQAMGSTTDVYVLGSLAEGLAVLAARMDPSDAAAACGRAAPGIVQAMGKDRYGQAGRLARGLAALAGRMDAKEASSACGRAAPAVVQAMLKPSYDPESRDLVEGLAALAARMDAGGAATNAELVGQAMGKITAWNQLGLLAEGLSALAARMDARDAAAACGRAAAAVAQALGKPLDGHTVAALAAGLSALAARMDARDTTAARNAAAARGRAIAAALQTLVKAADRDETALELSRLAGGLEALADQMDAMDVAAAASAVLQALGKPLDGHTVAELATCLSALAARMDARDARAACGRGAAAVLQAMGKQPDWSRLGSLAEGLAAQAARLDAGAVPATAAAVIQAMGKSTDGYALGKMATCLAALAARMDAADSATTCELGAATLLRSLLTTSDEPFAADAAKGLEALLRCEAHATRRRPVTVATAVAGLAPHTTPLAALALVQPASQPAPPPLSVQTLVDLLKHPFCVGVCQRVVLDQLSRHYDRTFADQWELVDHISRHHPEIDLARHPPAP